MNTDTDVRCTNCVTGPVNRQEILLGKSLGMLLSSHAKSSKLLSSILSQLQLWHLNLMVSVPSAGASAVGVNNPCVTEALLQSSKLVWMTSTSLK
jgi:glycerol uptake facilitator-like aquaporin